MKRQKVLLFDIETTPNEAYIYGFYEQTAIKILTPYYILSFSAKWLDKKGYITKSIFDYPKTDKLDYYLLKDLEALIEEADIIIGHNGDKFDIKKTQTRMACWNLKPPPPRQTIDTLKISKKYFDFPSNALKYLAEALGIGVKEPPGKEVWFQAMKGDAKALKILKRYNQHDVFLLEGIYRKFQAWHLTHPILGDRETRLEICDLCNGVMHRKGLQTLASGISYKRYRCYDCGHWERDNRRDG